MATHGESFKKAVAAHRKYVWTPEKDARLRAAYSCGTSPRALSREITELARAFGWPRFAISLRASRLGLAKVKSKRWTPEEIAYISENCGRLTVKQMAERLGRGDVSVGVMCHRMKFSVEISQGYSIQQACYVLGVSYKSVRQWIDEGHFGRIVLGRITEEGMRRFLRQHYDLYDLRRVDQAWFKGAVFVQHGYSARQSKAEAAA